jgi:hypothetical protein
VLDSVAWGKYLSRISLLCLSSKILILAQRAAFSCSLSLIFVSRRTIFACAAVSSFWSSSVETESAVASLGFFFFLVCGLGVGMGVLGGELMVTVDVRGSKESVDDGRNCGTCLASCEEAGKEDPEGLVIGVEDVPDDAWVVKFGADDMAEDDEEARETTEGMNVTDDLDRETVGCCGARMFDTED